MRRAAHGILLIALGLAACGGGDLPDDTVSARYHSMEQCLIGIRASSGSDLEIYHQTRTEVVGKLAATGLAFACQQLPPDGGYVEFEGWYLVDPA